MGYTQAQINDLLNQCMETYDGRKPDYWGDPGQCICYVRRWVDIIRNGYVNGPMGAPAAPGGPTGAGSNYWLMPPEIIAELFDKQTYNPDAQYPRGSLFVNVRSQHIGILLDNQPGQMTALVSQQNADPDDSPVHTAQRLKTRIDGILVIKVTQSAPPAPIFTLDPTFVPRQVRTNKNPTYKWGLEWDFDYMKDHPVAQRQQGEVFTAVAKVIHASGHHYYRDNIDDANGYEVADCDDYTPPVAKPYIPPAAPATAKPVEYYELLHTVKYYKSADSAKQDIGPISTLDKGTYVLLKTDGITRLLTKKNTDTATFWINDYDNRVPEVVPVQPTLPVDAPSPEQTLPVDLGPTAFSPDMGQLPTSTHPKLQFTMVHPVYLEYTGDPGRIFTDLENPGNPSVVRLTPGKAIAYSMHTVDGDTEYYVPEGSMKRGYRHGVPVNVLKQAYSPSATMSETVSWLDYLETGFKTASHFITDITGPETIQKLQPVKERTKQFIDGFSTRRRQ